MKPLAGFLSLADQKVHALARIGPFALTGFCDLSVSKALAVEQAVFSVKPGYRMCVVCVERAEEQARAN